MMFAKLIESAYETGSDMMVYLKGQPEPFRGSVRNWDGETFTLFHSGCCQGVLWAIPLTEVQTCGLIIPVPGDAAGNFCPQPGLAQENEPS